MKKTLRSFTLLLLAVLSLCAFACAAELSGECGAEGGNVTWHLDTASGVMTISGSGAMVDMTYEESICKDQAEAVKRVVVKEGVTTIGSVAFSDAYKNIESISLPKSLKEIGRYAFSGCAALKEIEFPDGLQTIGDGAFRNCTALTKVIVPDSVTTIGSDGFSGCSGLTEVKLPAWLGTISDSLFQSCSSLTSIVIPAGVSKIDSWAFVNCTRLNTVYFPKGLTTIAIKAFDRANALRTIYYAGTKEEWARVSVSPMNDPITRATVIPGWVDDSAAPPPQTLSGECGETSGSVQWELNTEKGILTISGQGAMKSFAEQGTPWYSHRDSIKTLVVKQGVTALGMYAFADCGNLTSVQLPEGLAEIWGGAFKNSGVVNMVIPESVKMVDSRVFENCAALESVKLPSGISRLEPLLFKNCTALKNVEIPATVYWIDNAVFSGCVSLTAVTLPENLQYLGQSVFTDSGIRHISIPARVEEIDAWGFQNCAALETLKLQSARTLVRAYAFEDCTALKELVLPAGLKMQKGSFTGCTALERVECLGPVQFSDLSYVGDCVSVFEGCTALKEVVLSDEQTELCTAIFYGCTALESIDLPEKLVAVPGYAFANCTKLKDVELSPNVTQIRERAFENCVSLTKITLPDPVSKIFNYAFRGCTALAQVDFPARLQEIDYQAFYGCTALEKVDLPAGVAVIGDEAFAGCSTVREVMLPDAVNTVGIGAFRDCANLLAVRIPAAVTVLPKNTFASTPLQMLYYGGTEKEWAAVDTSAAMLPANVAIYFNHEWNSTVVPDTFGSCGENVEWDLDMKSGVLTIFGSGAMTDYTTPDAAPWSVWKSSVTSVVIEKGVTTIGDCAFACCGETLKSVEIPVGVTRIGTKAFENCALLTEAELPNSVAELGQEVFSGCEKLQTVKLSKKLTEISTSAFENCKSLTSIHIPKNVTAIGHGTFMNCSALVKIEIPAAVTFVGYAAFSGDYNLQNVYYGGTSAQWEDITYYQVPGEHDENDWLRDANITYEWDGWAAKASRVFVSAPAGAAVTFGSERVTAAENALEFTAESGVSYDLQVKKTGCLTYTITGIEADGDDIDFGSLELLAGDVDGNDLINARDINGFRKEFGRTGGAIGNEAADMNGDGNVNARDINVLRRNFGKSAAKDCTVQYSA